MRVSLPKKMRVGIWADGGEKVGLGHLSRCSALANAMIEQGAETEFVAVEPDSKRWLTRQGLKRTATLTKRWNIFIADSYRLTPALWKRIRYRADTLLYIDDFGCLPGPCDWALNSTVAAEGVDYSHQPVSNLLLGPRFQPMRKEFWGRPIRRQIMSRVKNVLVVLGGGDGWGLIPKMIQLIRGAVPMCTLHITLGPFAKRHLPPLGPGVRIYRDPPHFKKLLEYCDMAVSAAGQTLYEIAYTGLPAVALELADNQNMNLKGFEKAGAVVSAGTVKNRKFSQRIVQAVRRLMNDVQKRRELSRNAQRLVDGQGARRVVACLLQG